MIKFQAECLRQEVPWVFFRERARQLGRFSAKSGVETDFLGIPEHHGEGQKDPFKRIRHSRNKGLVRGLGESIGLSSLCTAFFAKS